MSHLTLANGHRASFHSHNHLPFISMTRFSSLAACALALMQPLVSAVPIACLNGICPVTRRDLSPHTVASELGPLLSNSSAIFGPNDTRWQDATHRYQAYSPPDIQLVVEPGSEDDIPKIVSLHQHLAVSQLTSVDSICQQQQHCFPYSEPWSWLDQDSGSVPRYANQHGATQQNHHQRRRRDCMVPGWNI
jgi:hypothetical protein